MVIQFVNQISRMNSSLETSHYRTITIQFSHLIILIILLLSNLRTKVLNVGKRAHNHFVF